MNTAAANPFRFLVKRARRFAGHLREEGVGSAIRRFVFRMKCAVASPSHLALYTEWLARNDRYRAQPATIVAAADDVSFVVLIPVATQSERVAADTTIERLADQTYPCWEAWVVDIGTDLSSQT